MNINSATDQENQNQENSLKKNMIGFEKIISYYHGTRWTGLLALGIFLICDMLCSSVAIFSSGGFRGGVEVFGYIFTLLIVIVFSVWAIVFYFQTADNSFTLYEKGFKYIDKRVEYQRRWEDITEVFYKATKYFMNGIYTGTEYEFKILFKGGDKIKIGSNLLGKWNPKLEELGLIILDKTTNLLLPELELAFKSGKQLHFGSRLTIDKEKIYDRDQWVNLSDVKQIEVRQGFVHIATNRNSNWANIKVFDIANIMIFIKIMGKYTSVNI